MKNTLLLLSLFLALSCGDNNETAVNPSTASGRALTIMPLGASRVQGARPEFESYRYELWKLMVNAEWEFDYIGTVSDKASYPNYKNLSFDLDHEGRGGWTSGQIAAELPQWLRSAGIPDIVLFSSPAGNDALEGLDYNRAIVNINATIDILQEANPDVTILIERLAPAQSTAMRGDLLNYFNRLQTDIVSIAAAQTTGTSSVVAIDMFSGFTDDLLADEVHYNEAGARFIASRYFTELGNTFESN